MNRYMTQDMTKDTILQNIAKRLVCNGRTQVRLGADWESAWGALKTMLLLLMLTLGATTAWGQTGPVEITTDENGNGTIDESEKILYMIQTNGFQSFYMAPKTISGTLRIMTNNILGDYMLWYFLDAGTVSGTQYYYIVSYTENKYICHGGGTDNNTRTVSLVEKDASNEERCKFYLVLDESNGTTGFYNIDAKGKPSFYGLNKQNGSQNKDNPIRLTNDQYIHDFNSKWKFIRYNTFTWPTPPFTPSDDSDTHYYEIFNIQKDKYFASTDGTPDKVTFTEQATERRAWYFKEAPTDPSTPWFKYYYIINPSTGGKYMHYDGDADNTSDQTSAVSVQEYDSNNEDRYQFVVVQAARGDFEKNKDTRVECYAIIPKLLIDNLWTSNSLGLAEGSQTEGANMGIIMSRDMTNSTNGAHWKFDETSFATVCGNPVISFNNSTGKATISTTTSWPSIYYTTDGTTVPSSNNGSTLYQGPFVLTEQTTIKAIVTKSGYTDSQVETTTIYKVATPTIQQETGSHNISIKTATPNATIYYTTDGTNPTTSSTRDTYTGPSADFSDQNIKAIAVKDGWINSDIGEGCISIKCATPVISFDNITSMVTITCATEGSTIFYTTDGGEPSASSTPYTPFSVNSTTTVKAIATHATKDPSSVAELTITQVATPNIQNNGSNAISITTTTPDASIYYTTDGSTPTPSSNPYSTPLQENVSNVTIKAIAVKENMITSAVGSGLVKLKCATPVITRDGLTFTLSCSMPTDATLYYTKGSGSETQYNNSPVSFTLEELPMTVTAVAKHSNYDDSDPATMTLTKGEGTAESPYLIYGAEDFSDFVTDVNNGTASSAHYKLCTDVSASGIGAITRDFTGSFDGDSYVITGLTHPLFNTVNGGVVKNVTLKNVAISSSDANVGAIAGVAKGYSRIYNCGILPNSADFPDGTGSHPSVTTSGACAGGLVGSLEDDSRVINCYSYADVSAATTASGIVGSNGYASTAAVTDGKYANLRTAVVNCMFYGDILGGTNQYGVYGGQLITNATATGISSYNYFRSGSKFTATNGHPNKSGGANVVGNPTAYNCSFPAEERYLTQVEFHRSLLNSNRELCGWWVGSDVAPNTLTTAQVQAIPKDASLIYKWVVDRSLAPYPILKPFGKYASVINGNGNQHGTSTLTVTVQSGDHSTAADKTITLPITDMDPQNHDYGYYKVQLPYYNTVFGNPNGADWAAKYAGNYTDQVVTGWKIKSVTGGTQGSFVADWQNGYNFADRKCTDKDLYGVSERVFAQGGYYYVPDGVTAITIEAYWGTAIYVCDDGYSYDRVNITAGNTGTHFAPAGKRNDNSNIIVPDVTIYTTKIRDVIDNITTKKTVYDYAIVLVGNVQESNGNNAVTVTAGNTYGFTIMSADFDFDEEPDYCLEWQLGTGTTRNTIAPIRFDFLPVVELGIAGKLHNSTNFFAFGCFRSYGHFEVTETAFIHFGQFEFELQTRDNGPIILNGGIFDQYTRGRNNETNQHIPYVIVGGHLVMPSFTPGAHVGQKLSTRHCAVNALGGDFTSFYLTGGYREDVEPFDDNPHCYIDGGHFGTIAAAYKEGIKGNVTWRINHALIDEFYGGGMMSDDNKIVKGNIDVVIDNSIVGKYCGGPKFGNMVSGKTITTSATNTTFTEYYGAGNGGTNYVQYANDDKTDGPRTDSQWLNLLTSSGNGKYSPRKYINTAKGYHANYDYEEINPSTGTTTSGSVDRIYYYSAQFATTNTGTVTNTLDGCIIETNFYGGGFLGGVNGNVTSTLTDCTVRGSAFGAGYSASAGTVTIHNIDKTPPSANTYTGMIKPQTGGTSTTYYWTHDSGTTANPITTVGDKQYFYTEIPLDNLGTVSGNVTLNINGNTTVGKSVYGGGEDSTVGGDTEVTVNNGIIGTQGQGATDGNVYGGGKGKFKDEDNNELEPSKAVELGLVKGNTNVTIAGGEIKHNVYGGGAFGSVGTYTYATDNSGKITGYTSGGTANVTITGGTIGTDGINNGMVFGSSRGDIDEPGSIHDRLAWVYDTHVIIGTSGQGTTVNTPLIKGSVYGSGENGHTYQNTVVDVHSGTIGIASGDDVTVTNSDNTTTSYKAYNYPYRGNVYGGGCGTDKYYENKTGVSNPYDGNGQLYNPLAGIVQGNATVNIDGGHVVHNVYGAGAMGSVGTITNFDNLDTNYKHSNTKIDGAFYDFGLSWPYEFTYDNTGLTQVTIKGSGVIGVSDTDAKGGHVFGAARGAVDVGTNDITEQRYVEAKLANVRETQVTIGTANGTTTTPTIYGSVYGGGEDGHVYDNATVTIHHGRINHSVFGGGKGESTYNTKLWDATPGATQGQEKATAEPVHSWTAGKVYGNTTVTMNGGSVGYNIYGGGNLASVGKGNYAGGSDDYSTVGYGELGEKQSDNSGGPIWTNSTTTGTYPYYFMNSGLARVTINNGKVGVQADGETHTGTDTDGNPYGNVFGSSRGKAAMNVGQLSPRYRYVPDFFLGYVNQTAVTIGDGNNTPVIFGSVYGGGQDGHVRRSTSVIINKSTIGHTDDNHSDAEIEKIGNVFGAGSGLGQYNKGTDASPDMYYNNSSGSVTCSTNVEVNADAYIYRNVYGGGALASVGPPNMGQDNEQKEVTSSSTHQSVSFTQVDIKGGTIEGDVYGSSRGGSSLGANWYKDEDPNSYATNLWSTVNVSGGAISGDVFGGGEAGQTKCDVEVNISGGTITKDVYGGGALAHTNTSNWVYNRTTGVWGDTWADGMTSTDTNGKTSTTYTTTVNLTGGQLRNAYGGGLGIHDVGEEGKTGYVEGTPAYVYGDVTVKLNEGVTLTNASSKKGCIVEKVFGCNNLKGTPKGHVQVYVYATQHKNQDKVVPTGGKYTKFGNLDNYTISNYSTYTFPTEGGKTLSQLATSVGINTEEAPFSTYVTTLSGSGTEADKKKALANMIEAIGKEKYDVQAVYGGGNLAPYDPVDAYSTNANTKASARTEVYIEGCELTSIKQVYAGGNAAPAPATLVQVYGTYEIEEVFGGGNGKDNYTLNNGTEDEWFVNPGANVGYRNYTHLDGNGSGTELSPYSCADNTNAATKEQRRATYMYGSGVATTEIYGGRIHYVYGGSNEKGNISEEAVSVYEEETGTGSCTMDLDQTYGGGKNSIIDGRIDMGLGCVQNMAETFGGSKNADVNSDIVLNITNGTYGRVFGGNNTSGNINGSITVNIYEDGCSPIRIGDLYLGGYLAGYSIYGYKADGSVRTKDEFEAEKADALTGVDETDEEAVEDALLEAGLSGLPRQDPRINIISATRIDNIYGGGYEATVVGSPHVNVNMEKGRIRAKYVEDDFNSEHPDSRPYYTWTGESIDSERNGILPIGTIGNIFGGGDLADIIGDTYVEIGTGRWVSSWDANGPVYESKYIDANDDNKIKSIYYKIETPAEKYTSSECTSNNADLPIISTSTSLTAAQATRLNELLSIDTYSEGDSPSSAHAEAYNGALDGYITTADIKTPATWAWYTKDGDEYNKITTVPTPVRNAATITGDVFGGGKGQADANTFKCDMAMVGVEDEGVDPTKRNGGTSVVIENGTVDGSVYGGGRLARVEKNTVVTIGSESGIGTAVIEGDVYGAGMGVDTHGYSGLVRGNATVTIQDDAKVKGNVYGGGQKASLGRFFVATTPALATLHHVEQGMPYDLKNGGTSTVIVRGSAQIGPDAGASDDNSGHVFGAGKGTLPGDNTSPKRYYMDNGIVREETYTSNSAAHLKYIETLGITNKTNVVVDGSATVKGSVYGGSMSGFVRTTTDVNIQNGTINGDVFGGGLGSTTFSEAGRVSRNTEVTISDGTIKGNVYGGGSLGDVGTITKNFTNYNYTWKQTDGTTDNVAGNNDLTGTNTNTGICTVTISGGTIGVDVNSTANHASGHVFGAGKGSDDTWWCEKATVFATNVSINGATTVYGNVYGGGQIGRVEDDAKVTIGTASGADEPDIKGNVFGAGAGIKTHGYSALLRGHTEVTVQGKASVGANVYGGGEIATVGKFWVTGVVYPEELGAPTAPTDLPDGMPYALRDGGTCTVTVQDNANITGDVFGAGMGQEPDEFDTYTDNNGVEHYYRSDSNNAPANYDINNQMPKRMATYEAYDDETEKGFKDDEENRTWVYYDTEHKYVWEYFDTPEKYHTFLQTLAIVNDPILTIKGNAEVNGSAFGGSESGFVLGDTQVNIQGSCKIGTTTSDGDVFGGGKGLATFAEAGKVKGNTNVEISGGTIYGNVYGGGSLGDVGTITKEFTRYNYTWKQTDGSTANVPGNNNITSTNNNTGICTVEITGGTIGFDNSTDKTKHGNVFGAGRGLANTFWCEKAMAFATDVSIKKSGSANTLVYGNVYGGGEVGRVEDDAKVIIGTVSDEPEIKGSVYGAGAGTETHGYSALVRGNSIVTVQGGSKVGGSVFGGGEKASLGRFKLDENKLPKEPDGGGYSTVTIKDNAKIGLSGTDQDVYGAGQGIDPSSYKYEEYTSATDYDIRITNSKRMTTHVDYDSTEGTGHNPANQYKTWDYYEDDHTYVWEYYPTLVAYQAYLNTLAIASHPTVTIAGKSEVNGSVFGGGQRGVTLGNVNVNISGGTVGTTEGGKTKDGTGDVYGGGALADTNLGNWDVNGYVLATALNDDESITDLYTRTETGGKYTYTKVTDSATEFTSGTYYRQEATWASDKYDSDTYATYYKTNVTLTGGTIKGNVYGGGLGQIERAASAGSPAQGKEGEEGYVPAVPAVTKLDEVKAKVYGDIFVDLNGTPDVEEGVITSYTSDGTCVVQGNVFGCNNQNGSPQSAVTVHIYKTNGWEDHMRTGTGITDEDEKKAALNDPDDDNHSYELHAVYGGGNLSAFYPDLEATRDTVQAYVIIDGCDETSIKTVYGGGNAASTPATNVTVNACYEIEEVFGGGNGKDDVTINGVTKTNPGANVGYVEYPTEYDIPASSKTVRTEKFGYGSGRASVNIYDGLIHRVFGGSNNKGNVRESAVTMLEDMNGCHFQVDEAYGGGKNAPMDAEAKLLMACIPGLKAAYGGAQEADILGGVTLTITNGTYERVFGGNNISGTIQGPIVVNVEETGCRPIIIGELYGGGNKAAYSIYGYKEVNGKLEPRESATDGAAVAGTPYANPVLNVKSFTSIGDIYGGGYGKTAVMVGAPTVNVNVTEGKYADTFNNKDNVIEDNSKVVGSTVVTNSTTGYPVPSHAKGAIGAINNVFGGGNEAKVVGNPNVYIGTRMGEDEYMAVVNMATTAVTAADGYYTRTGGEGTAASPYTYTEFTGTPDANTTYYKKYTIKGADIHGNVYGGGNAAEVEGDTNVVIGKNSE